MKIDDLSVNNLRILSCDLINNANSGHSGIALSASPILYSLYANIMKVNPANPKSIFRDRFVLSAGHGSSLLYSTLHMFGYDISVADLKSFKKLDSPTPGHPEVGTPGVDCSSGPLGQGVASAVGMAIAERFLSETYNKPDIKLFDNYTYALVGDGCLMEGVSHEALSLAGTLKLNKLIVLYDENKASLDSKTSLNFTQNTKKIFEGYGFNVLDVKNGNDVDDITSAIKEAKTATKPSLIIVHTAIGYGTKNEGSPNAHNAMFDEEEFKDLKKKLKVHCNAFEIMPEVENNILKSKARFKDVQNDWNRKIGEYGKKYKKDFVNLQRCISQDFSGVMDILETLNNNKEIAVRDAGGKILNEICKYYPNIIGGTADLSKSTKSFIVDGGIFNSENKGRNILYGVREFGMSAIANGIALYGGLKTFVSTFTVFSDYLKPGLRMSALMNLPVMYLFSHDGLDGALDGGTHQSIEQLTMLRSIPNLYTFKPCDFNEAKGAYAFAMVKDSPTAIVHGRNLAKFHKNNMESVFKGGYVLSAEMKDKLDIILLSCGTEIDIMLQAQQKLFDKGINSRVVSMPCSKLFDEQSGSYKNKILPINVPVLALEMGVALSWEKYATKTICLDNFSKCSTVQELKDYFGFTPEKVVKEVQSIIR